MDASATTQDLVSAIREQFAHLLASVDQLGEQATTLPVTPEGWTAKDVLAHLIHYAGQVAFALGATLEPPPYVRKVQGRPSGDEWNALAVAHFRDWSLDEVRRELEQITLAIIERATMRTDDEMHSAGAVPWAPSVVLWQFIAGDTFLHWDIHTKAIEDAARRNNADV
ncbi:MAG: ClbS/DfsB family four-helix bundle protein [Dehalococcoidia bacterium]